MSDIQPRVAKKRWSSQDYFAAVLSIIYEGKSYRSALPQGGSLATMTKHLQLAIAPLLQLLQKKGGSHFPTASSTGSKLQAVREGVSREEAATVVAALDGPRNGRPEKFDDETEQRLFQWVLVMQRDKHPVKLATLLAKARNLLKIHSCLENEDYDSVTVGRRWFAGFVNRMEHAHGIRLCLKGSSPIEGVRISHWRRDLVYRFYDELKTLYRKTGLWSLSFHEGAKFIVNFDETPIPAEDVFRGSRVVGIKGEKKTEHVIDGGSSVKHITVVCNSGYFTSGLMFDVYKMLGRYVGEAVCWIHRS